MSTKLSKHAIQLEGILVKELFIRVNSNTLPEQKEEREFQFGIGHSDYDDELKEIDVGVIVKIGKPDSPENEDNSAEFDLKVHLLAKFTVDSSRFPLDQLEHWAENNAPLVLYPYIREHVHALSVRAGVKPIFLPLMEVPTIKIENSITRPVNSDARNRDSFRKTKR